MRIFFGVLLHNSEKSSTFAADFNERAKIMKDIFIHYDTPEQYAEAFQNMINAREKWREEIRQQTAQMAL